MFLDAPRNAALSASDRVVSLLRELLLLTGSVQGAAGRGESAELARLAEEQERVVHELEDARGELEEACERASAHADIDGPPVKVLPEDRWAMIEELTAELCMLQRANTALFGGCGELLRRFAACVSEASGERGFYRSDGAADGTGPGEKLSFSI